MTVDDGWGSMGLVVTSTYGPAVSLLEYFLLQAFNLFIFTDPLVIIDDAEASHLQSQLNYQTEKVSIVKYLKSSFSLFDFHYCCDC